MKTALWVLFFAVAAAVATLLMRKKHDGR